MNEINLNIFSSCDHLHVVTKVNWYKENGPSGMTFGVISYTIFAMT